MRVSTFLYVRVCAPEKERDTHRKVLFSNLTRKLATWYNWERCQLERVGWGKQCGHREQEDSGGFGCFSTHWWGGSHYEWTKQRDGRLDWKQPEPVCCLKSLPLSLSPCSSSLPSFHLCVIRVLAGRMISCHPQWWPSTA